MALIQSKIVALDGHDAAGKTTLANALAKKIGGLYRRPFHGSLGSALLRAGERRNFDEVIALGEEGLRSAIDVTETKLPIVLDRSWITVASLIEQDRLPAFFERWKRWIPTALCWADLETTLQRLRTRAEPAEAVAAHWHYLSVYRALAERGKALIVRTDIYSEQECLEVLSTWFTETQEREWRPPILD